MVAHMEIILGLLASSATSHVESGCAVIQAPTPEVGRADDIDKRLWTLLDITILVPLSSATMDKPSFDPGFTEKYRGDLLRIINPNGQFNVRRRGATWRDVHPYLSMINVSWPAFVATIFAGYVVANLVFAFVYLGIGVEHLHGAETNTAFSRFQSAFFFSAQTFTLSDTAGFLPRA